ncbi:MAG: acetolactate decarboxylase [Pseudomonadota bacterium]
MPQLCCEVSQSLMDALREHESRSGESLDHMVMRMLAQGLDIDDHATLFQVSTSGALIEGVTDGAITVEALSTHGDLGLGTFADLDGEMVILDGQVFQIRGDGTVTIAAPDELVPFAVATRFTPEDTLQLTDINSYEELLLHLNGRRNTDNQFFALRMDGTADYLKARVVEEIEDDQSLVEAAQKQVEFELENVEGQFVGFWSPAYASSVNISGWHIHFLSADRSAGGHLLDLRGAELKAQFQHLADFHIAIPETASFLQADLSVDPSAALEEAER